MNRKQSIIIRLTFFVVALGLGYRLGATTAAQSSLVGFKTQAVLQPGPDVKAMPANGYGEDRQRGFLMIVADDLEASRPNLRSVWYLRYDPPSPQVSFLPVYPASNGQGESMGDLAEVFRVKKARSTGGHPVLDPKFMKTIEPLDLMVAGYILVDEVSLKEVYHIIASDSSKPVSRDINSIFSANGKAQPAQAVFPVHMVLMHQVSLAQELCWGISQVEEESTFAALGRLPETMPTHFASDQPFSEIFADLQQLHTPSGVILCDFPTITMALLSSQ